MCILMSTDMILVLLIAWVHTKRTALASVAKLSFYTYSCGVLLSRKCMQYVTDCFFQP